MCYNIYAINKNKGYNNPCSLRYLISRMQFLLDIFSCKHISFCLRPSAKRSFIFALLCDIFSFSVNFPSVLSFSLYAFLTLIFSLLLYSSLLKIIDSFICSCSVMSNSSIKVSFLYLYCLSCFKYTLSALLVALITSFSLKGAINSLLSSKVSCKAFSVSSVK